MNQDHHNVRLKHLSPLPSRKKKGRVVPSENGRKDEVVPGYHHLAPHPPQNVVHGHGVGKQDESAQLLLQVQREEECTPGRGSEHQASHPEASVDQRPENMPAQRPDKSQVDLLASLTIPDADFRPSEWQSHERHNTKAVSN
jgi:hypothetical protein